ncbi:restriction endonuclease subunit S [Planctomycetota bacterium]|nr:restriction endonuclease subunit S [Planctomycetota bacterium]
MGELLLEEKTRNDGSFTTNDLFGVFKGIGLRPMKDRVKGKGTERCKVVRPGEFAYNPMRLNIGSIAQHTGDGPVLVSPDYVVFSCRDHVVGGYLDHFRRSHLWTTFVSTAGRGGVRKRVYFSVLSRLLVPLPSLAEQQKIAAVMSSADDAIRATQAVIDQTRLLEKALLADVMTRGIGHTDFKETAIGRIPQAWEPYRIGELAQFKGGSQPPRSEFRKEMCPGYVRLIQIRDYKSDAHATFVPEDHKLTRRFCEEDDVMIGRYGPPVFQILRGLKGAYNVALVKAIPRPDVSKDYLFNVLRQETLFQSIEKLSRRTSGQAGVNMDTLRDFPMPLPPPEERIEICRLLSSVRAQESVNTETLRQQVRVRSGLLEDLVTGRVRVSV